ncbi:MAG: exodeoxyribonuclease V subunit gamma [Betaproteobacteria bacterium]|nr:exodeoxyribonuclease V subunit gamma [Betaproteobacteria bacterium]
MPLSITFSNRFEYLLEALLERLAAENPGPFETQTVIVPSIAVRRRIELAAADRFGVCAGIDFPFLGQWLWRETARWTATLERSPLDRKRLAWGLYAELEDATLGAAHPALGRYLSAADANMRLELAERIADVFDAAVTYRTDWAERWRQQQTLAFDNAADDETARWLGELWRRVTHAFGLEGQHPFIRLLQQKPFAAAACAPEQPVHLFALPALAPLHLELLRAFSSYRDIHLHTLNPCREHWFEIVPARRLSFLAARSQADYHETGNRLLAAWGRQTQAHIDLLFENDEALEETGSAFFAANSRHLLGQLQNAILDLHELAPGSLTPPPGDRSIELHVCHSLTRQLEALQDRLLSLLATEDPIRSGEVLVVVPDLSAAAPLIDAVFGAAPPARRIPYTITGRGQTHANSVARTLAALLGLLPGRFPASAVFDLLQQPPIAARYELDDAGLETLRGWLGDAGIRWGLDAAQRGELGLPESELHTFADGIERLFLAYAMGDAADFGARSGAGNPEGQSAQTLGQLSRFVQDLSDTRQHWRSARNAQAWHDEIAALLERYIPPSFEWAEDLRSLRGTLTELTHQMSAAGDAALPPEVVIRALSDALEQPARGGVPTGGLTFAALASLRPLPYRMICILGLDDGAFPSADRPAEFDLIARHPRRGDRQRRADERNLFLDLLLGARDYLYLSHTGRSLRDNAALPPSVLAAELLDALATASATEPDNPASVAAARAQLIVEHPLQPFSAELFSPDGDPRLRSHNAEFCAALRASYRNAPAVKQFATPDEESNDITTNSAPFFTEPLPLTAAQRQVPLDAFFRFFRNPSRALLRERLGIQLSQAEEALDDAEPFVAGYRERRALAQRLEPEVLAGGTVARLQLLAEAGGEYPTGSLGRVQREQAVAELAAFSHALAPLREQAALAPAPVSLAFDLDGDAWRLDGNLSNLRPAGQIRCRFDALRPSDRIDAILHHLVLCATQPENIAPRTLHIASGETLELAALSQAEAKTRLHTLLEHYRAGLARPLHFFPKSAWAYAESNFNLAEAWKKWEGNMFSGESEDAYHQLALRGIDNPLDVEFERCAVDIFGLLLPPTTGDKQ